MSDNKNQIGPHEHFVTLQYIMISSRETIPELILGWLKKRSLDWVQASTSEIKPIKIEFH